MLILALLRRLLEIASTFLLVTAVGAFVWLFAEQKTVHDQTKQTIDVTYGTPEQQKDFILLTQGAPTTISFSFKASNRVADEIRANLTKQTPFHLPLDLKAGKDEQTLTVSVRERLEKTLFANVAASNIQVDQDPQVTVTAERIDQIELPLDIDSGSLPVEWNPKPEKVTASLPAGIAAIWKQERNRGVIRAFVGLDKMKQGNVKPGEKVTRQVPVEIPALNRYLDDPSVTDERREEIKQHLVFNPKSLDATFTLDEVASESVRITRSVPVTIASPSSLQDKWAFSIPSDNERFLKDLRLTCTPEIKDRIEKNEANEKEAQKIVWAVVRVVVPESEIPSNGIMVLPLEVVIPPGAAIIPTVILPKTITVKATRRNSNP